MLDQITNPKFGKIWILALVSAVLFLAFILRLVIVVVSNQQLKSSFTESPVHRQYINEVPVDEIDYASLDAIFPNATSPVLFDLQDTILAPKTINYYKDINDTSSATYTINKDDTITVLNSKGNSLYEHGAGLLTYPSYKKGWRYAKPFQVEGNTHDEMLYVELDSIEAVASVYADLNPAISRGGLNSTAVKNITLNIDKMFYTSGVYLSPDYYAAKLAILDWSILALSVLLFSVFLAYRFIRVR